MLNMLERVFTNTNTHANDVFLVMAMIVAIFASLSIALMYEKREVEILIQKKLKNKKEEMIKKQKEEIKKLKKQNDDLRLKLYRSNTKIYNYTNREIPRYDKEKEGDLAMDA